ncbi:MAG: S16 family serine protease [Petrotogales bacterium]
MVRKILITLLGILMICSFFSQFSVAVIPGEIREGGVFLQYRNVTVYAPAVAQTTNGYVGVISTITVTIQNNGSGRVFVDTLPLTQIDMQGSARLAVKVASALVKNDERCNISPSNYDYFFVVRTSSPIIGGPSAGAIMTAAVVSLLENWTIDSKTVMTGMINPDGSIGPVGGIIQKIDAAYSVGATRFLIPKGQGTYTETITETVSNNGWTQIITRQVTRNVTDYARENYVMDVVEVEDINDVLVYLTGWDFPVVESQYRITTEDYIDSMKPLASDLLNEANESYTNASNDLKSSDISNRYPFYYKDQVLDILKNAEQNLQESQEWYEQKLYYTSTSNSFQSLIDSRFVSYACEYFSSNDKDTYVNFILNEAKALYNNKSGLAKNADINGMVSLQCVGAAQKRASDADSYLSGAENSYNDNDYLTALYKIAYGVERSKSVGWWIDIASSFNDTGEINMSRIRDLAGEYIEDAQQAIVYSGVILQEMGKSSSYLDDAEDLLEAARDDKEKSYPAAALFEALESLVKANLALELVDGVTEGKIERARETASNSIGESRDRGIEPILAVSYYEYAQSLADDSSFDSAIVYYKYSDLIAGALGFTSACGGHSSRYIGIPEVSIYYWEHSIIRYSDYFILFAIIGGIGGVGVGILIARMSSKKRVDKRAPPKMQRNINNYYKKQKNQYFSEKEIPRSIKDYYKKNK